MSFKITLEFFSLNGLRHKKLSNIRLHHYNFTR